MDAELEAQETSALGFQDYWAILRRRRRLLAVSAFVVWAVVWTVTWFLPVTYRSETLILIDAPQIPQQYVVPNITADIQQRLRSMSEQILSRTRLLRVIEESNLYPELRKKRTADEVVQRMRKDITIELVQAQSRDVTAFKIYYVAATPQLAQHVTGELTRLFIDENVRSRQEQSENTTEFLEGALEQARKHLAEQEARLRDFRSRYLGQLPGQLQPNMQILAGLQTQLEAELDGLNRAKQQNLYYKSLLGQYRSIQSQLRKGTGSPELPTALDQELARLKNELNNLSARYTENHPDIRKLKEQIAQAEKMKRQIATQLASASATAEEPLPTDAAELRSSGPMLEIESQLKANELEITNRQERAKRISEEIAGYRNRINQIPLREQQMADLTRDYDQSRANYESLLAKRNQSELATNLEKRQKGEQFRTLDPPSLPQKPYWPNRLQFSLIGLAAGIAVGAGLTAVLEIFDDRVHKESDVSRILPIPMLVAIPPLLTTEEVRSIRLRNWAESAALSVMAVMIMAAMVFTYRRG
jgi:succinoglycan biosynthesis transport protein ExoP